MKTINRILFYIALAFLTLHIFSVNTRLLYQLNPDSIKVENHLKQFSIFNTDENTITAIVYAIAYSVITAIIIAIYRSKLTYKLIIQIFPFVYFGLLDGFGVLVYYNTVLPGNMFVMFGSWYYAIYSFSIIVFLGIFSMQQNEISKHTNEITNEQERGIVITQVNTEISEQQHEITDDEIQAAWGSGAFKYQKDLAEAMNVSAVRVTRALKLNK